LKWTSPAAIALGVQDSFNNVFNFTVDFNRRRRVLSLIRNGVRSDRFKHRGMEDWKTSVQSQRQLQGEGNGARLSNDLEQTLILRAKLV